MRFGVWTCWLALGFLAMLPTLAWASPDDDETPALDPSTHGDLAIVLDAGLTEIDLAPLEQQTIAAHGDIEPLLAALSQEAEAETTPKTRVTAANWTKARLLIRRGNLADALTLVRELAKTHDELPVLLTKAWLLDATGRTREAFREYTRQLERIDDVELAGSIRLRLALMGKDGNQRIKESLTTFAKQEGVDADLQRRIAIVLCPQGPAEGGNRALRRDRRGQGAVPSGSPSRRMGACRQGMGQGARVRVERDAGRRDRARPAVRTHDGERGVPCRRRPRGLDRPLRDHGGPPCRGAPGLGSTSCVRKARPTRRCGSSAREPTGPSPSRCAASCSRSAASPVGTTRSSRPSRISSRSNPHASSGVAACRASTSSAASSTTPAQSGRRGSKTPPTSPTSSRSRDAVRPWSRRRRHADRREGDRTRR